MRWCHSFKFSILYQVCFVFLVEVGIEPHLYEWGQVQGHGQDGGSPARARSGFVVNGDNNVYKIQRGGGGNTNGNTNTVNSYFFNQNKNWEKFQSEHIFNPDENPGYENWRGKEWRRWMLKTRASKKSMKTEMEMDNSISTNPGRSDNWPQHHHHYNYNSNNNINNNNNDHRRRHGSGNLKLQTLLASMKHIEVVIIARPLDVLASFTGSIMQYGTKNQAMVWSKWSFPTLIFQKAGKRLRVFDCREMHIAGRLLNGYPTYLHDFYPSQIRNPLGGNLRYPVDRRCNKIPQA